jgi:hypothetical protein
VYRLAALLTGNPVAAAGVIDQVIYAQPDLSRLDGAHMDRLTVLRSREIPGATLVSDLVPQPLSRALAALTPQQREAYVLVCVFRTSQRETARAMDCSTTAVQRHLQLAEQCLAGALGQVAPDASRTLLAYSQTLDVPAFYRQAREQQRRVRRMLTVTLLVVSAAALLIAGAWLAHWLEQRSMSSASQPATPTLAPTP